MQQRDNGWAMTKIKPMKIATTACSGLVLAALATGPAFAMNGPVPIKYNLGSLGEYSISGGVDGYGVVYNNGTGNLFNQNPQNASAGLANALIDIQKTSGLIQFNFEAGEYTFPILGSKAIEYPTGSPQNGYNFLGTPVLQGYVTLAPSKNFSISAGIIPTVEGMEQAQDWNNFNFFLSQLANMEITSERGIEANLTHGPATLTVQFDDGYFSKRFNNIQAALTYNLNSSDYVYLYGSDTVGTTDFTNATNGFPEVNSNMIGGGVSATFGKLTVIPYVQYQWLPKSRRIGNVKTYSNIAFAISADYQFTKRWSLGSQVSYMSTNTDKQNIGNAIAFGNWMGYGATGPGAIGPGASLLGFQVTPTWQYKQLFVRTTLAYAHLSSYLPGFGYGTSGNKSGMFAGILEAGFLF